MFLFRVYVFKVLLSHSLDRNTFKDRKQEVILLLKTEGLPFDESPEEDETVFTRSVFIYINKTLIGNYSNSSFRHN